MSQAVVEHACVLLRRVAAGPESIVVMSVTCGAVQRLSRAQRPVEAAVTTVKDTDCVTLYFPHHTCF